MAWTCCDSEDEVKMDVTKVPLGDGSAKAWGETGCTAWDEWSQQ